MKGLFAVTVAGIVVVIAAIIVNDAHSPDGEPALPPEAGRSTAFAPGVSGTPASTRNGDMKADCGPVFDLVRVAPDGHAIIAGQAEPGSRVVVLDSERPLGEVFADARGEWVFLPPARLEPGTVLAWHTIWAIISCLNGNFAVRLSLPARGTDAASEALQAIKTWDGVAAVALGRGTILSSKGCHGSQALWLSRGAVF